jgi:hypothetical protein
MRLRLRKPWKSKKRLRELVGNFIVKANGTEQLLFYLHHNIGTYSIDDLREERDCLLSEMGFVGRLHEEFLSHFIFFDYYDAIHPDYSRYVDRAVSLWGKIDTELERRNAAYLEEGDEERDDYELF